MDEVWLHTEIVEPQLMQLQSNPLLWKLLQLFHRQIQVSILLRSRDDGWDLNRKLSYFL